MIIRHQWHFLENYPITTGYHYANQMGISKVLIGCYFLRENQSSPDSISTITIKPLGHTRLTYDKSLSIAHGYDEEEKKHYIEISNHKPPTQLNVSVSAPYTWLKDRIKHVSTKLIDKDLSEIIPEF